MSNNIMEKRVLSNRQNDADIKRRELDGPGVKDCKPQEMDTYQGNEIRPKTSATSSSTFSVMAKDPSIVSSSLLRELFMALVGVQIVYIVTNVIANCDAAAIVAGSAAIQAIICHLDARPISYWVSAILSAIAAVELILSLFIHINGLEQLQLDPILKWMTIFYGSSNVVFVCICCYLATTFARLISHEKKHIQKSLERIKTGEEEV